MTLSQDLDLNGDVDVDSILDLVPGPSADLRFLVEGPRPVVNVEVDDGLNVHGQVNLNGGRRGQGPGRRQPGDASGARPAGWARAFPTSARPLALARVARVLLVTLVALVATARPAAAHPLDLGYLRIDARAATVSVALDLHVNAAARLLGLDGATATAADLEAHAAALADATFRGAPIATPAGACRWTTASASLRDRTATVTGRAECPAPPRALRWAFPFVGEARVSPTFQVLVKAALAGEDKLAIVDAARPTLALSTTAAIGFGNFVWTGVEHIGAAPTQWHDATGWRLPDGLDHILFLLALMLAGGSLARMLGIVSGFTLGHSITLALSALHVVRPPASLIEPLIAASIAYVAARVLLDRRDGHRWWIAACFGLVHGFGFASALNQLELPTGDLIAALFGYNLGVELGQIAIVLAAAPIMLHLHRHPRYRPLVRALAAAICVAGVYWFVQRLG
ncbi:MAG TPA: HupE/UreJ family protein [Kofleriaceae bacterium]|nr:HupE/UreJ family protein [Kofleriaceae bacterium]